MAAAGAQKARRTDKTSDSKEQLNIHLTEEAAREFREYCSEHGWKHPQGIEHLLEIAALNKAKETVPERELEISEFEMYEKRILELYLSSIEYAKTAEMRAMEEFRMELSRKDEEITFLKNQLKDLDAALTRSEAGKETLRTDAEASKRREQDAVDRAVSAETEAADKARICAMMEKNLAKAEDQLRGFDELRNRVDVLEEENSNQKHQIELMKEAAAHAAELAARDTENRLLLQKQEDQTELERALNRCERSMRDRYEEQIRTLSAEIAVLRAEVDESRSYSG